MSAPTGQRFGFFARFGVALVVALGGAGLYDYWAPHDLEVIVEFDGAEEASMPRRADLRVVRPGGAEFGRARRERLPGARSLVTRFRLSRGTYRLELWDAGDRTSDPGGVSPIPARWEAELLVEGRENATARVVPVR